MSRRGAKPEQTSHVAARTKNLGSLGAMVAVGAFAVMLGHTELVAVAQAGPTPGAVASEDPPATPRAPGRYRATRRIVVDRQTGQLRMPTTQEVEKTVETLATLTRRTTDGLPEAEVPGGGTGVDLQGGFGGVMLARPNDDGTYETRCVFTFEEGADFLGLARDDR